MEKLLKFIAEHYADDVSRLILDRKKYPEIDIDLAVNCIESRRKLKGKVQEWHDNPSLIFPLKLSAEQCSSSATGRYKAELAVSIVSNPTIADLTGGLGVDSWFFSQKASKVIYNEMQSVLCEAAKHNFKALGAENIIVFNNEITADRCLDSLRSLDTTGEADCHFERSDSDDEKSIDIVYMDPARRGEGGKKVFLIEDCTPDVLTLKDKIFKTVRHILIKLSPMADITMVCNRLGTTCREVHVVGTAGECKELLIWMDRKWNDEYTIIAAELNAEGTAGTFAFKPSEEKSAIPAYTSSLGKYLFEPGKALMKAGAFNLISAKKDISKLGRSTHYYTTDDTETASSLKQYGKVFEIIEYLPLDKRSLKHFSKQFPKSEVTARNIPMDSDTLKKKMGITSGDDAHIFGLKCDSEGNLLIAAKRLR